MSLCQIFAPPMLLAVVPGSLFEVQCSLLTCWPYVHWAHLCTALITVLRVCKFGPYKGGELSSIPSAWAFKGAAIVCIAPWNIPADPWNAKCFSKALNIFKGIFRSMVVLYWGNTCYPHFTGRAVSSAVMLFAEGLGNNAPNLIPASLNRVP